MRRVLLLGFLSAAMLLGTIGLGWWTVPLLGAAWGASRPEVRGLAVSAALAGALAWGVLLAEAALGGPVGELAGTLGGIFGLPGFLVILLTLVFPAFLAGSAAALAATLRGMFGRSRGSASGAVPP
jgi:hypothetical protein